MQRSVIYLVIFIVILFYSCGRRPRYVLPEDKMMDVLYDIQLAQAIYRSDPNFNTDEKKDALIAGVLHKYKISQADLDSSLLWYSDNIEYYMAINDSVASRLRASNTRAMDAKSALAQGRDFSNLIIPPFYNLTNSSPTLVFNIDSTRLMTIDYPRFSFKFNVHGLNDLLDAEAAVFFTYKDTLVKRIVPIDQNSIYTFSKPQLADSLLKSITGYVHVANKVRGGFTNVVLYDITYIDTLSVMNNEAGYPVQNNNPESLKKIDTISERNNEISSSAEGMRVKEGQNTPGNNRPQRKSMLRRSRE
ncbi:DUF4296 domain-containing protein [Dysgonomonas sp. Marseille-P4677]|uniref:DUF4296 domain-containing protein n=1 Tax=Dysgonomonas sp. Marseille-P4677 TaxID=2364790 RepID=UPI001F1CB80D|nr:DUF4296 domain-containing protein [Dysgonomonas sp. Marseille-P4677]